MVESSLEKTLKKLQKETKEDENKLNAIQRFITASNSTATGGASFTIVNNDNDRAVKISLSTQAVRILRTVDNSVVQALIGNAKTPTGEPRNKVLNKSELEVWNSVEYVRQYIKDIITSAGITIITKKALATDALATESVAQDKNEDKQ